MRTLYVVLREVGTYVGLVPLAVVLVLEVLGRRRDVAFWWIAVAFAVSTVADVLAIWWNPWTIQRLFPIAQLGILWGVFGVKHWFRWTMVAAVLSLAQGPLDGPEVILNAGGGFVLCWMIWRRDDISATLRCWLLGYFGLGGLLLALFPVLLLHATNAFVVVWVGYQLCRVWGIVGVSWSIVTEQQGLRLVR